MFETIYTELEHLSSYSEMKKSYEWATGEGITRCLIDLFEDSVSVIHCNMPLIDTIRNSKDLLRAYIEEIEKIINSGFVKPIIIIWDILRMKESN